MMHISGSKLLKRTVRMKTPIVAKVAESVFQQYDHTGINIWPSIGGLLIWFVSGEIYVEVFFEMLVCGRP